MTQRYSVVGSARLIALWTLLSRVTGLARDIFLNFAFGQGWVLDAFNYGFQIPNLFRRLFGEGALAAVFVPTFTERLHRDGPPAAWVLLGRVVARLTIALVAIILVLETILLVIWLAVPTSPARALIIALTALMLPFMLTICIVALLSSILNCLGRFGVPAAMPILLNLCMIAGIACRESLFGPSIDRQVFAVALAVLAAGGLQLILMVRFAQANGAQVALRLDRGDPDIRAMRAAFIPVVLGQGVLLLNSFMDTQICTLLSRPPSHSPQFALMGIEFNYPLEAGALSAVTNAQRLYQFPLGVLAISLATAAFPMFSRYAAQHDYAGLRRELGRAMRLAVFEGLPCGLMLTILAEPIVSLLFQYGKFTHDDAVRAASVLRWYGVGVWAFCLQHVVLRGFYSIKDTRTPMWIGGTLVAVNLCVSFALIWIDAIREQAFAVSTTITTTINVVVSVLLLRRRLGGKIGGRLLVASWVRIIVAAGAASAVAAWISTALAQSHRFNDFCTLGRSIAVAGPLGAAIAVYLSVSAMLRTPELRDLFRLRHGPTDDRGDPDSIDTTRHSR